MALTKNWDNHVAHAEAVARTEGFAHLRDLIVERAALTGEDVVVDVGSGTGLLTLAAAPRVAKVWGIDISPAMTDYLSAKAESAGLANVETAVASAISLPLVDGVADVVLSNYCFHHLADADKDQALLEARRVLRPGGRLVFGDMMFRLGRGSERDRQVVGDKVRAMVAKGPAGIARLAKNGLRYATGRWEHPAPAPWWEEALRRTGFTDVEVRVLDHEGGVAYGRVPDA